MVYRRFTQFLWIQFVLLTSGLCDKRHDANFIMFLVQLRVGT